MRRASFCVAWCGAQDRVDLMAFSDAVDEIVPFTNDVHAVEKRHRAHRARVVDCAV